MQSEIQNHGPKANMQQFLFSYVDYTPITPAHLELLQDKLRLTLYS